MYNDNVCKSFEASTWLDIIHFITWENILFRVTGSKINLSTYLIAIMLNAVTFIVFCSP